MSDLHPASEPRRRDWFAAWSFVGLAVVALGVLVVRGQVVPVSDVVAPAPEAWTIGLLVAVGLLVLAIDSVRADRLVDARSRAIRVPLALALVGQIVLVLLGARPAMAAGGIVVGVVALAVAAGRLVRLEPARTLRLRATLHGPLSLALGWAAALTPAAGEMLGEALGLGGGEASVLLAWAAVIAVGIAGTSVVERVRAPVPFAVALVWGLGVDPPRRAGLDRHSRARRGPRERVGPRPPPHPRRPAHLVGRLCLRLQWVFWSVDWGPSRSSPASGNTSSGRRHDRSWRPKVAARPHGRNPKRHEAPVRRVDPRITVARGRWGADQLMCRQQPGSWSSGWTGSRAVAVGAGRARRVHVCCVR